MNDSAALSPVGADDRIQSMDVLRGFALLGILLMNIEGMVGPLFASLSGVDPALTGADHTVDTLIYLFVQGKFFPLFSLLFGMGFAVILMRATDAGRPFFGTYLRRVLALLAIGLAHAWLVWSGDILVTYALLGLLMLLLFRRTPVSRLPKWGVAFVLLPCVLMLAGGLAGSMAQMQPDSAAEFQAAMDAQGDKIAALIEAERVAYGSGSYAEATAQRLRDFGVMMEMLPMFGAFILGLFLVGAWFARSGAVARPHEYARVLARLRWVVFPIGVLLTLVAWRLEPTMDFARMDARAMGAHAMQMLGGAMMMLGYLAWILRALQGSPFAGLLAWLAPAGRMALTHYLLQSLAMTWIFYGYGLGYFEQLPRAWQPLLVFAFFALQVAASHWWLARFRFGPAEWLWRWLTYGRRPPMRMG
ncbi:DUF418 domain-containing protein [Luteimonas aestuarii]|uniref:DUF418 domain-containing protein n=1 Tax=Luteimonas aestuarii TaxID=453837 RepID=A0A4R5TV91_9GAMM|nr:DUF418 domain-containing protein [Luteimonas aestuarii]TDK25006.1 DUF418 domain-containing protein [Luteimonas aestuarii]